MTKDLAILGCGITGLVATSFYKNSNCFENRSQVALDMRDNLFPKYLLVTPTIENFLKSQNIQIEKSEFKIGIFYKDSLFDFYENNLSDEEKLRIYETYCLKKYGSVVKGKMNGFLETKEKSFFIRNKSQVIDSLYEQNKDRIFLNHKINKIDIDQSCFWVNDQQIFYKQLISTIPIQLFSQLSRQKIDIKFSTINCSVYNLSEPNNQFDFIYVVDESVSFNRVKFFKDIVTIEFTNRQVEDQEVKDFFEKLNKQAILLENFSFSFPLVYNLPKHSNIEFMGRFAEGDYSVKFEDVVERLVNGK